MKSIHQRSFSKNVLTFISVLITFDIFLSIFYRYLFKESKRISIFESIMIFKETPRYLPKFKIWIKYLLKKENNGLALKNYCMFSVIQKYKY